VSSETSAIRTQTPGNYPKRNKLHLEHGGSLKTKIGILDSCNTLDKPGSDRSSFHQGRQGGGHSCKSGIYYDMFLGQLILTTGEMNCNLI